SRRQPAQRRLVWSDTPSSSLGSAQRWKNRVFWQTTRSQTTRQEFGVRCAVLFSSQNVMANLFPLGARITADSLDDKSLIPVGLLLIGSVALPSCLSKK